MLTFLKRLLGIGQSDEVLVEILKQKPLLVDVRSPQEFKSGSAKGAINIPLGSIEGSLDQFKNKDHVVVFCLSGMRSAQAKNILLKNGITSVTNGGTWVKVDNLLSR
jgi:phage shock protein E